LREQDDGSTEQALVRSNSGLDVGDDLDGSGIGSGSANSNGNKDPPDFGSNNSRRQRMAMV
jgi:hypothetical protein